MNPGLQKYFVKFKLLCALGRWQSPGDRGLGKLCFYVALSLLHPYAHYQVPEIPLWVA